MDPSVIVRQSAAGDDAMQVGVEHHLSSPGMQHGGDAWLGVPVGLGELKNRGGSCVKEQVVDALSIGESNRPQGFGEGENDMEVMGGNEALLSCLNPAELLCALADGAVPISARVEGVP